MNNEFSSRQVLSDDYSLSRIVICSIVGLIASIPLLLFRQIPIGGIIFILCFLIPIQMICLKGIFGRRIVSIDCHNKLLVVTKYSFYIGRKTYDLSSFSKITVSEKRIVSVNAADSFSAPSGHEKGTVNLVYVFLYGDEKVEIAEFRYDFYDKVSKDKVDDFVIECIEKLENLGIDIEY